MYIPGRFLTASRPSSTCISSAPYSCSTLVISIFSSFRDVNLSELHAINYDGNDFAGAWHITEREEGDTYNSFTYVFDGDSSAYLMMGSMGYISNYELNPDINQIATQMMFGINGKYNYEFSDDKNTVTLTDSKTKKKTTLEKYMSFSCIPLPL